ncbi:hypothetical protein [Streptomyces sp. NPDC055681]
MVKGGDWVFGSQLVDGALQSMGLTDAQLPARLFCPQVVTETGAKLSKSLIRDGRAPLPDGAALWMLDTQIWPGSLSEYAERLLAMADPLLSDPRHLFRSYSTRELGRRVCTVFFGALAVKGTPNSDKGSTLHTTPFEELGATDPLTSKSWEQQARRAGSMTISTRSGDRAIGGPHQGLGAIGAIGSDEGSQFAPKHA